MKRLTVLAVTFVCCLPALADGYRVTLGQAPDDIPLVVVKGTPYEMGFALGSLMKEEVPALLESFLGLAQMGGSEQYSDVQLDAAWDAIKPHTSPRFEDELKGVADGSGMEFDTVRRAHMIPVVAEYACSGAAVWGQATENGHLFQFRNLDYIMEGGLQNYPCVVIYLPDEGIAHINPSFAGSIGSNTGMNAEGIALTEMGDSPGRERPYNLDGIHFTAMFRDILYDAHNLDEAVDIIESAPRIKKYHFIIGDGKNKQAVKMLAHAPNLTVWHDNDKTDEVAPNILENVVYNCEGRDPVGYAYLKNNFGSLDLDSIIQLSKSVGTRHGNLLNAVYDATALELWVAYAHDMECAYRRPYVHIKMNDYLDFSKAPEGAKMLKQ